MGKIVSFVIFFAIGYFGYQYYMDYKNSNTEGTVVLNKLEAAVNEFCDCSRSDYNCLRSKFSKMKALLPEFEALDRQGVKPTSSQKKRAHKLADRVKTCHQ